MDIFFFFSSSNAEQCKSSQTNALICFKHHTYYQYDLSFKGPAITFSKENDIFLVRKCSKIILFRSRLAFRILKYCLYFLLIFHRKNIKSTFLNSWQAVTILTAGRRKELFNNVQALFQNQINQFIQKFFPFCSHTFIRKDETVFFYKSVLRMHLKEIFFPYGSASLHTHCTKSFNCSNWKKVQ